jgi:hypothetical protein
VLESIKDKYYGFNLKMNLERKTAEEIVLGNWMVLVNADEFFIGCKVAKELLSWVIDAIAWERFVVDIEDHAAGSRGHPSQKKVSVTICLFNLRGLEWNKVWLPTWMILMMLGRKRRPFMTKKKRMMRKMKNRILL